MVDSVAGEDPCEQLAGDPGSRWRDGLQSISHAEFIASRWRRCGSLTPERCWVDSGIMPTGIGLAGGTCHQE
eukprot:6064930-Karenia_brevis.AAC.1